MIEYIKYVPVKQSNSDSSANLWIAAEVGKSTAKNGMSATAKCSVMEGYFAHMRIDNQFQSRDIVDGEALAVLILLNGQLCKHCATLVSNHLRDAFNLAQQTPVIKSQLFVSQPMHLKLGSNIIQRYNYLTTTLVAFPTRICEGKVASFENLYTKCFENKTDQLLSAAVSNLQYPLIHPIWRMQNEIFTTC